MSETADTIVSASFDNCCALCCIFLLVTFLNLIDLYDLPAHDPQVVFGYISVIHLIALPIFYFHFVKKSRIIFLFLNLLWIILMATAALVYSLKKPNSGDTSVNEWKKNPLSHVLLTVYLTCGILLEVFTFIAHNRKIHSRHVSSTTSTITTTSPQRHGSQGAVPLQQVTSGSVATGYPTQTYQVVTTPRSPPPRPPPPALVTYHQPEEVILTPSPPIRPHRKKKREQAIVSPVLSTTSGTESLVMVPGVQLVSDPSV